MTTRGDKSKQQFTRFKWGPKKDSRDTVLAELQPAMRLEKADCLDLPDLMYQTREVPLSPQVEKYYRLLKKEMVINAAGEDVSAVNAAAMLSKLLQLSGGALYTLALIHI